MFYISICSVKGYETALDNLLSSFPENFKYYIIIYQKEPKNYWERKSDGHYEVHLTKNIYEYGAWEGLYLLKQYNIIKNEDYILMLHDTCKLGKKTFDLVENIISSGKVDDIFWASNKGQANICITKGCVIDYGFEMYKDFHCTKKEAVQIEWNKDHQKSMKSLKNIKQNYYKNDTLSLGLHKVYSDIERLSVYYESIDIEKYLVPLGNDISKIHPNVT